MKHYLDLLQQTIRENWDEPALSDYRGATLSSGDLARDLSRRHLLFEAPVHSLGGNLARARGTRPRWAVTHLPI